MTRTLSTAFVLLLALGACESGSGPRDAQPSTAESAGHEPGKAEADYRTGPGSVPPRVRENALAYVEADYFGRVDKVYQEARTDFGYWRAVHPRSAVGHPDQSPAPGIPVYVLYFEGRFEVQGPAFKPGEPNVSTYHAGRVIVIGDEINSIALWEKPRDADPPFGRPPDEKG